ncbi:MAG: FAD-binding protein [Ilumatobacteraceae bacterium]
MDLDEFAAAVGDDGQVAICGLATRGGAATGVRCVQAPAAIEWVQPDEMVVSCGAGTPVDELVAVLARHGQTVALPAGGTVGGALACGVSDIRRLGHGPVRDVLLQARYVSAAGEVVKAGGPTVKNVSGFDLPRLLVGSRGALGFLGDVILRTRPLPPASQWFTKPAGNPFDVFATLYRPVSVLWNGERVWVLLEGHAADVVAQQRTAGLQEAEGPPKLPAGSRRSVRPAEVAHQVGEFVAEVGIGIVHHSEPWSPPPRAEREQALARAIKHALDPTARLNPGVDV